MRDGGALIGSRPVFDPASRPTTKGRLATTGFGSTGARRGGITAARQDMVWSVAAERVEEIFDPGRSTVRMTLRDGLVHGADALLARTLVVAPPCGVRRSEYPLSPSSGCGHSPRTLMNDGERRSAGVRPPPPDPATTWSSAQDGRTPAHRPPATEPSGHGPGR